MLRDRLLTLYGPDLGERTADQLEVLLARFRPRLAGREQAGRDGSANDALLITYGDTILGSGRAPLAALREFAARHLEGRVSGIHLLPIFPYSSDYGFSVTDYLAVRADLGTWADVAALHADFQLMFDFVSTSSSTTCRRRAPGSRASSEGRRPSETSSSLWIRRPTCRWSPARGRRRC